MLGNFNDAKPLPKPAGCSVNEFDVTGIICSQRWMKKDRDKSKLIKKYKLFSKRQRQGLIKQRVNRLPHLPVVPCKQAL